MNLVDHLASALDDLSELAAPRQCGGCALPHRRWCSDCAQWWEEMVQDEPIGWVTRPVSGFPSTWSHAAYAEVLTRALPAYKDDGRTDLTGLLATVLRASLAGMLEDCVPLCRSYLDGSLLVVCAPSSASSVRARGRRPLHQLAARSLAPAVAIAAPHVLRFARSVRDQSTLGATGRLRNIAGSMRAQAVAGKLCLVIDDVVTSGATLAECARALRCAGARQVFAVTAASVLR